MRWSPGSTTSSKYTDEYVARVGFREARFTPDGFFLNGRRLKLRGLNRHQTFPYVGVAMPARVQRRDALILKHELKCNVVRTSHYPQSAHFLDCCDETGLMVFEEIPGWQHIGDEGWKTLACRDVEAMIRRDWNHPSIVLWGVRINESQDDHDFYARTNKSARELDDSRQTGGVRYFFESELLEDVFGMNDFLIRSSSARRAILSIFNSEFVGHMFPTKRTDNVERTQEHALRHARVHDMLGADDEFAGGIGGDIRLQYPQGVLAGRPGLLPRRFGHIPYPKPAAGFYKSQCDPEGRSSSSRVFTGRLATAPTTEVRVRASSSRTVIGSRLYIGDRLHAELQPDRERFGNLAAALLLLDVERHRTLATDLE